MPRVAILTHDREDFARRKYVLHALTSAWERRGIDVVVLEGAAAHADAGVAILHVNQTVLPPEYEAAARRFPRVLNARVRDISKRAVSKSLVRPGDGWDGPVIVKTDLNHGGIPEARMASPTVGGAHGWRRLLERAPWRRRLFEGIDYPRFDRVADVPRRAWADPRLVVERFLPERHGDLYAVRIWMFLGEKERIRRFYSREPVIKATNVVRSEPLDDVPAELRRLREAWGFDFGKFDYAIHDGELVVFDLNKTPSLGRLLGEASPLIHTLAEGIGSYL